MANIEFEDKTGQPEDLNVLKEALRVIEREVITNHMAKFKDGTPTVIWYAVVVRALKELIYIRERFNELNKERKKG